MKKAFTLIELVMVIVIIGIIAVVAIPKAANIKQKAINRSEQALMSAAKVAINAKHMQNIIEHPDQSPDALWPCQTVDENPFKLMHNPPSWVVVDTGEVGGVGGPPWQLRFGRLGVGVWEMMCPCLVSVRSGRDGNGVPYYNKWRYCSEDWFNVILYRAGSFWGPVEWHSHSTAEEMAV